MKGFFELTAFATFCHFRLTIRQQTTWPRFGRRDREYVSSLSARERYTSGKATETSQATSIIVIWR